MPFPSTTFRLATPALLALVLTGCGGGGGGDKSAAPPCPVAPVEAGVGAPDRAKEQVPRPVPKRDHRELDRMTAADASLVSLLRSVEQGGPAHAPAARPQPADAADEPSCAQAKDEKTDSAGH